jgi:hypothetical protein
MLQEPRADTRVLQPRNLEGTIHALSLEWRRRLGGSPEAPSTDQEQPLVDPQFAQR